MADFQVPDPILNSPYEEPSLHWWIEDGSPPQQREGRRPAMYFYRDPKTRSEHQGRQGGEPVELKLVNQIRDLVATWRHQGCPGASRTTHELLSWWRREGREKRLFFAQVEAVETIIFLREARSDFLQGVDVPRDEPNESQKAEGAAGFLRYASKLATGSGKTTVMGMLAAWSILNKVNDRADARFSDVVLVVCPNVTIRQRLAELDPNLGDASLYRTRDLVPEHLMKLLRQGKVVITNWHVFEPHVASVGGQSGRVVKAGQPVETRERIHVGEHNTTARGKRYLTLSTLEMMTAAQQLEVLAGSEKRDEAGNLISVEVRSTKYVESDSAVIARVLGREVGGKQNILVMNDEAHHAYRIRRDEPDEEEDDEFGEDEEADEFYKEATIWVDGLDRVQKLRGVNFCVDLSATPYFLGRVGQDANRPFPWVVSDFGLIDAIESGLVKIPQLAIRDSTGAAVVGAEDKVPSYFNIWHWILPKLTPAERGGKRANPKPEAILKYAHTPIAMLGGLWEETAKEWAESGSEPRPPVFIIICKNTALAKVFFEWIAHEVCPTGIPPLRVDGFRNRDGNNYTIRVDSKVVHETDTGGAKNDASRWMRFTLDTVGKLAWPRDRQGREVMPEGFEDLAKKMEKPLHPPGRDVRCIVSVGMLTEGWDCNTVTHIVGLRPFMSQLLCEQVVGRGLRRASYEPGADGRLPEEVAKVFGVPFEVIPFKANKGGAPLPPSKRIHVRAVAEKERFALTFPRVDGYTQAIRNRVVVDWKNVPTMTVDPTSIPPEVQMKGLHAASNTGRPTLGGPGRISDVSLKEFRTRHRLQELVFELARELTKSYLSQPGCTVPAHVLFPQCASIVQRYVDTKVTALPPADIKDLFLAPYYGWLVERLTQAIRPDTASGEEPEIPRYEVSRGPGSTAEVSFFTSRDVREGQKCHLNFSVLDTGKWEQSAVYFIDTHPAVEAFVKNAGLGFAVPYFHNGQPHDYVPDFIVKLSKPEPLNLIVETKGYDPLQEVKADAAKRWCDAVNADNRFGKWRYALCKGPLEVRTLLDGIMLGNA